MWCTMIFISLKILLIIPDSLRAYKNTSLHSGKKKFVTSSDQRTFSMVFCNPFLFFLLLSFFFFLKLFNFQWDISLCLLLDKFYEFIKSPLKKNNELGKLSCGIFLNWEWKFLSKENATMGIFLKSRIQQQCTRPSFACRIMSWILPPIIPPHKVSFLGNILVRDRIGY